jgi:hypothetical protein
MPDAIRLNRVIASHAVRSVIVFGVCLLAALAVSWPLALHLTTAIPLGTELEATVPLFNLWTLWWTADRVAHGLAGYWNAPIFYPTPGTFSFSEPQPLTGLALAAFWGMGMPPALIYNSAFLGLLTLNGVFAYRVARALRVLPLPAVIGAAFAVMLPFVTKLHGVLPLLALFGALWSLEGLVRFAERETWLWAVWAAVGFVVSYLTCQQCALLFAPFLAVAGIIALERRQFRTPSLVRLIASGLVAAIAVGLVALPELRIHAEQGFERTEQLVEALSARPADFLSRPDYALLQFPPPSTEDTAGLFPGVALTALALGGFVVGVRDSHSRRWTIYLVAVAAAAALLALGLNLHLGAWRPFATLRAIVPGLSELRSPFRYAAVAQVCLALLASFSLAWVSRSGSFRSSGLAVLLGLLVVGESLSAPAQLVEVPAHVGAAWTGWLRAQSGAVIAHVPFPPGVHVSEYERETWRMLAQIDHGKPIVNGYSGYLPQARNELGMVTPAYLQFQLAMAQKFPEERLLCVLGAGLGVNTLVVDASWREASAQRLEDFTAFLQPTYHDDEVRIFRLQVPPDRCRT